MNDSESHISLVHMCFFCRHSLIKKQIFHQFSQNSSKNPHSWVRRRRRVHLVSLARAGSHHARRCAAPAVAIRVPCRTAYLPCFIRTEHGHAVPLSGAAPFHGNRQAQADRIAGNAMLCKQVWCRNGGYPVWLTSAWCGFTPWPMF